MTRMRSHIPSCLASPNTFRRSREALITESARWIPPGSPRRARLAPAFNQINEFKHRLHRARRQADLGQALIQSLRPGIAPAAFGHECIPHFDFLIARLAAMSERPREQFLVAAALER